MGTEPETAYQLTELLACAASRMLEDQRSVFVGTGLPMVAAMLAQRTHAPNLLIIFPNPIQPASCSRLSVAAQEVAGK